MEKCILVEYLNSFNAVINQTFKSAKRIKLTCFDVSKKYIIFGASSGGIYIFKRDPCEFIKLIPSKEGSVSKIVISPNEKNIAIANSKGLVIIIESYIDTNLKFLVNNHHDGTTVTEIKWNGNDIYCGDNTGKISIFSLNNLLTIFHTSSAVLMQLDSSIVQIDTYLNYLLISTQSRSYLCDTEKEQYKQIGKKLRDGNFGSCFSSTYDNSDMIEISHNFKGVFKTVMEDEQFTTCLNNTNTKIYCARPGARIWEVNFEATVLKTYQFKESLTQFPSDMLQITDASDSKLTIKVCENVNENCNFNFGKIYPICNQVLFTYNAQGIYFFDLQNSNLLLWNNNFKYIRDIKILNSVVYIWQNDLEINTISLESLENLIIKTLLNKQYYLCGELCARFMEELQSLLDKSQNIHLISILKVKLDEIGATQILEEIKPILSKLEERKEDNIVFKKLKNGIVLVDNVFKNFNIEDSTPESVENACVLHNDGKDTEVADNLENTGTTNLYEVVNQKGGSSNMEEIILLRLYKQYQLNKSHKNAELTESSMLLEKNNLDTLLVLFEDFIKFVETLDNTDARMWCKEQFLKQAAKKVFDIEALQQATLNYLTETFLELNTGISTCKCKFPLPKTHKHPIAHYNLGCKIFGKLENQDYGLNLVPYLYRYKLSKIDNLKELVLQLPLLIQFSERHIFEQYLNMFTYDTWDEIVKLFIKLKQGLCLNCGEPMDLEGTWSWTILGILMIKSIGPANTCRLLKRYSTHIPKTELDEKFYQCCIFSSTFREPHLAVDFMQNVLNENTTQLFEDQMEKYLYRKYLGYQFVAISHDERLEVPKCSSCELPLNEPIINEIKKCECGHSFHSLCLLSNHGICNVCTTT